MSKHGSIGIFCTEALFHITKHCNLLRINQGLHTILQATNEEIINQLRWEVFKAGSQFEKWTNE